MFHSIPPGPTQTPIRPLTLLPKRLLGLRHLVDHGLEEDQAPQIEVIARTRMHNALLKLPDRHLTL